MYVVVVKEDQEVYNGKTEELPLTYGPYESMFEAVGSVTDLARTIYDDEPWLKFEGFGYQYENLKVTVMDSEGEYMFGTINKLN